MGIVLNIWLTADDNVVSAATKPRRMPFYLKRSLTTLTTSIFLALYKFFIRPHLENAIQASHPIPPYRGIGKGAESCSEVGERASPLPV